MTQTLETLINFQVIATYGYFDLHQLDIYGRRYFCMLSYKHVSDPLTMVFIMKSFLLLDYYLLCSEISRMSSKRIKLRLFLKNNTSSILDRNEEVANLNINLNCSITKLNGS